MFCQIIFQAASWTRVDGKQKESRELINKIELALDNKIMVDSKETLM